MNSSDSEEDFESADEELDFNHPSKHSYNEKNTKIKPTNKDDEAKKIVSSPDTSSSEIICQLDTLGLRSKSVVVSNEAEDNLKTIHNTINNSSVNSFEIVKPGEGNPEKSTESSVVGPEQIYEPNVDKCKDVKSQPLLKKLGTKIARNLNQPIVQCGGQDDLDTVRESKNGQDQEKIKVLPHKLGIKLSANYKEEINTTKFNEGTETVKKEISQLQQCLDKNKAACGGELANVSCNKYSENLLLPEESDHWEAGDGWEIEEEDGFEIPVSLGKTSNEKSLGAQQMRDLDKVECQLSKEEQEQGWSGWGGWGVSSLLSSATGTVTVLSSQVSAGLSTVLETTVGAPEPETLAASMNKASEQASHDKSSKIGDEAVSSYAGLGSIVSGVSFLGSTVINRGLDTLETIGKKTMEVLQEGDPGLKKKRAMLFQNQEKPILSQILREAKEKADNSDKEKEEKETARKIHFESLFDDFHGMVHLEALEMLSTQCELKIQSMLQAETGVQLLDLQETLAEVRELCELTEDEENSEALTHEQFTEKITVCVDALRIKIKPTKLVQVNSDICKRLEKLTTESAIIVNECAISSLAELTASAMECFHKSAELLLAKSIRNTPDEAENYVRLTNHLCARVSAVANEFTQLLTKNNPIANSLFITNIFLEASNSCTYIKNACQLLIPILQVGAVAS